jgi:hypothetical protein
MSAFNERPRQMTSQKRCSAKDERFHATPQHRRLTRLADRPALRDGEQMRRSDDGVDPSRTLRRLGGSSPASRPYRPIVSRRWPVSASIARSDRPLRNSSRMRSRCAGDTSFMANNSAARAV